MFLLPVWLSKLFVWLCGPEAEPASPGREANTESLCLLSREPARAQSPKSLEPSISPAVKRQTKRLWLHTPWCWALQEPTQGINRTWPLHSVRESWIIVLESFLKRDSMHLFITVGVEVLFQACSRQRRVPEVRSRWGQWLDLFTLRRNKISLKERRNVLNGSFLLD